MALTLRQIDAFRSVMLLGTLTEAALHLGISQPAISRLIADLEEEIGFKLFDRSGRRVVPTSEAQMLVDEVRRALVGLDQIKETALEIGRLRYSRLRLITIHSIAATIMTDLIDEFSQEYPETLISLEVQPADAAVEWVVSQQCDLGLVLAVPESPALGSKRLLMGPAEAILPLGHSLAGKDRIVTSDLEGESFVSFRPDSVFRSRVDQIFQREGVERAMRYEARTMEAVCSMVAAGLGVSIVGPLGSHSRHLIGHRFHVKPFEPRLDVELSMIWSTHRPLPVVAQKFLDLAEGQLKG